MDKLNEKIFLNIVIKNNILRKLKSINKILKIMKTNSNLKLFDE